jgi:hypothetical protein
MEDLGLPSYLSLLLEEPLSILVLSPERKFVVDPALTGIYTLVQMYFFYFQGLYIKNGE